MTTDCIDDNEESPDVSETVQADNLQRTSVFAWEDAPEDANWTLACRTELSPSVVPGPIRDLPAPVVQVASDFERQDKNEVARVRAAVSGDASGDTSSRRPADADVGKSPSSADGLRHDAADEPASRERLGAAADASPLQDLSKDQVEVYLHNELMVERVDLAAFDEATARDLAASLTVLRERFPAVEGLHHLGTVQDRNLALTREQPDLVAREPGLTAPVDVGLVAETLRDAGDLSGIAINQTWAADHATANVRLRLAEAVGDSAQGVDSLQGVVAHEFGHLVQNQLTRDAAYEQAAGAVMERIKLQGADWIRANVSGYAAEGGERELFAELFAEYVNAEQPRPAADMLGKRLDEYFRNRLY